LRNRFIFGPKKDEVTGELRKLHNEALNDLYSSPNIVRVITWGRMGWVGHVERMGEVRGLYGILVGKPDGKRLLGRPRRRWEDNIMMDLQKWNVVVWTGSKWLGIETGGGQLGLR
jgi:hypothetical protein